MTESGALPIRHLSIRVPWHDAGWNGTVCSQPAENVACLCLGRIREQRRDAAEALVAGRPWDELSQPEQPPCVNERGGFLSPFELRRTVTHPYAESSRAHRRFSPTELRFPPFSAACIPFR